MYWSIKSKGRTFATIVVINLKEILLQFNIDKCSDILNHAIKVLRILGSVYLKLSIVVNLFFKSNTKNLLRTILVIMIILSFLLTNIYTGLDV